MMSIFHMPTRLYHGAGALNELAAAAAYCGIRRPLIVTDPVIVRTPFFAAAMRALTESSAATRLFDQCGIDARLSHIDDQARLGRADAFDGVVAIGGGSVLCTGKGIATTSRLPGSLRELVDKRVGPPAGILPMIGVPTTAGSGAEVSQFTVVKDDRAGGSGDKLVFGGPWAFPKAAILDPVVLSTLPGRLGAVAAVDAVTHAVEALFSREATPLTDTLAIGALDLLVGSIRASIHGGDDAARADNLLGAAIANVACGNTRLCLAHALSVPLEATFGLEHGVSVGILMPHVVAFNGPSAPAKLSQVAKSFGVPTHGEVGTLSGRVVEAFHTLYEDLGLRVAFDPTTVDRTRLFDIACHAAKGLYGEGGDEPAGLDTAIPSPNIRTASVRDAIGIYESSMTR